MSQIQETDIAVFSRSSNANLIFATFKVNLESRREYIYINNCPVRFYLETSSYITFI